MADDLAKPVTLLGLVDKLMAAVAAEVDPETGEVSRDAALVLDMAGYAIEQKTQAYHIVRERKFADAEKLRQIATELRKRADQYEREVDRLDARMQTALEQLGHAIKAPGCTAYLHPTTAVELTADVPDDYCRTKVEVVPDRAAIKAALEAGEQLPFAQLVTKHHVRYR